MARSTRTRKPKKQHIKSDAEQIAALYVQARTALVQAGRALHDQVGSSLSAAGVQLQLLRMDLPAAKIQLDETLRILDETLDHVRILSQDLSPSPAYRGGLQQALLRLADQYASGRCQVEVEYSATASVPPEIAAALHEAAVAAVEQAALQGAERVRLTARGARGLVLRISDDGRKSGRGRALSAAALLAREQGLKFERDAGNGTIIIRYAV